MERVTISSVIIIGVLILCWWSSNTFAELCELPKQQGELTYSCNPDNKTGSEDAYQDAIFHMENFLMENAPEGLAHGLFTGQKYRVVGTLYGYAKCFFDYNNDRNWDTCRDCLSKAIEGIQMFCPGSIGAQYTVPPDAACCMRYENYDFFPRD